MAWFFWFWRRLVSSLLFFLFLPNLGTPRCRSAHAPPASGRSSLRRPTDRRSLEKCPGRVGPRIWRPSAPCLWEKHGRIFPHLVSPGLCCNPTQCVCMVCKGGLEEGRSFQGSSPSHEQLRRTISVHAYIHTCLHIPIHTQVYWDAAYTHAYMRVYIHTYIYTYIHTYIHTREPTSWGRPECRPASGKAQA